MSNDAGGPASPSSDGDGSEAHALRFHERIESMREGTRLYLSNDFRAAEDLFKNGMAADDDVDDGESAGGEADAPSPESSPDDSGIDLRGAFALQYAIVGLLRGVASMEDDQLDDCLARLWEADRLASLDAPWVGRKVVRGVCHLTAGVVECLRKTPVRGAFHVAGSWRWLRHLKSEALEYDGLGREVVRSAALLGLGAFALILSLLPDGLVGSAASYLTGFEVEREAGLRMLRTCQEEGEVLGPIGALAWVAFQVDTKAFLGEDAGEDELAECERMLDWASARFDDSLFFGILRADLLATQRRLIEALAVLDHLMALPVLEELRALKAMLMYKKAIYHLAALQWDEAGEAFETSQAIYKAAGRRSLGPAMAVSAAHCYCIARKGGAEDDVKRMMDEVAVYKEMDKSNWVRSDRQAFKIYDEYVDRTTDGKEDPDDLRSWSLLHLATGMALVMRCTLWMSPHKATQFVALLDGAGYESIPDEMARAAVCVAQVHAHQGNVDAGLARCTTGLDLVPALGRASMEFGTVPMLHYLAGHLHCVAGSAHEAEACLRRSVDATTTDMVLHNYLSFKTSQLRRRVRDLIEEAYVRVDVPAGRKVRLSIGLSRHSSEGSGSGGADDAEDEPIGVSWDWCLDERDIDFGARFVPSVKSSRPPIEVVSNGRHDAGSPVRGSFCLPAGCEGGTLELTFSNVYSYLRGKVVTYKLVLPPNVSETPDPVVE